MLAASIAHADPPSDLVARPIVLDAGQLDAQLTLEAALGTPFAQPESLAPDLWFGVTSRLTVGVVHSDPSLDRITTTASFCVVRNGIQCDRFYEGSGLDARWGAMDNGELAIAPRVRLYVHGLDPTLPATTVGALIRWHRGRFAIVADPYLRFSLAHAQDGNRGGIVVPVYLELQPTCRWMIDVQTGWDSEFDVISDGWHVPVAVGVTVAVTRAIDVGATFGFTTALGPQNDSNQRVGFVTVAWRPRVFGGAPDR
jgi:hypothetical protein